MRSAQVAAATNAEERLKKFSVYRWVRNDYLRTLLLEGSDISAYVMFQVHQMMIMIVDHMNYNQVK